MTILAHIGEETERHASEIETVSDVATIGPIWAIAVVGIIIAGGFLVWRFILRK